MKSLNNKRDASVVERISFKVSPIAAGCAVLLSTVAGTSYAQQATNGAEAQPSNVVVVTGIRQAIESAISVKKNSNQIVESVSAEDIGKLPDQSIAESLTRLPGVSGQRNSKTGAEEKISVRGMSPDFSGVTLNSREQATTEDGRAAQYSQYPSELLSGAQVYKTPNAALIGQGLSGTINMETVKPLNYKDRQVVVGYKRQLDGVTTDKQGHGNRYNLSYIDQFADHTLGVLLGYARLERKGAEVPDYSSWGNGTFSDPTSPSSPKITAPTGFNLHRAKTDEKRDAFNATIEFKPSRDFSSSVDVFYTKYHSVVADKYLQMPLNIMVDATKDAGKMQQNYERTNYITDYTLDDQGNVLSGTYHNVRVDMRNDGTDTQDKLSSIGWNTSAKFAGWTGTVDWSYSRAKRQIDSLETTNGLAGQVTADDTLPLDTLQYTKVGASGFTLKPGQNYADLATVKLNDTQGWGGAAVQAGYRKVSHLDDKINALRFDLKHDLPEGLLFQDAQGGLNFTRHNKSNVYDEGQLRIPGSDENRYAAIPVPNASVINLDGIDALSFDPVANLGVYDFAKKDHPDIFQKDWNVHENITTGYLMLNLDQDWFVPVHGNVGLQIQNTKLDSRAFNVDTPDGTAVAGTAPYTISRTYNDVLPSLNLNFDAGHQQIVRVGLAKIMMRPNMADMRASNSLTTGTGKDPVTGQSITVYKGSGGNPNLDPYRAKSADISYEKYFGTKGYVAAAAFYKKLDSYIIPGINTNYDFTNWIQPGSQLQANSNIGTFSTNVNGQGGNIKGIELTANLPLDLILKPLDGFGMYVSYTGTDSNVSLPNATGGASTNRMQLPGLSRQVYSGTAYYEKYGFSARVGVTKRSDYVGSVADIYGNPSAVIIKGDKVVDLQLGYEFSDGFAKGLSLSWAVNNLYNEPYIEYQNTPSNITKNQEFGRQVLFGASYKL